MLQVFEQSLFLFIHSCFFPDILAGRAGPDRVVLHLRRLLPGREAGAGAGFRDGALRAGDAGGGTRPGGRRGGDAELVRLHRRARESGAVPPRQRGDQLGQGSLQCIKVHIIDGVAGAIASATKTATSVVVRTKFHNKTDR